MFKKIVQEIRASFYAYPGANVADLDTARLNGVPSVLLQFYKECDGCFIGSGEEVAAPDGKTYQLRISRLSEIQTTQKYGYVEKDAPLYDMTNLWWQVIEIGDANWLAFDASKEGFGRIIDVPHEEVGYEECHAVIAETFMELLQQLIKYDGQDWFGIDEWQEIDRV